MVEDAKLPEGLYDVSLRGPPGRMTDLQEQFAAALKTGFGVVARSNNRSFESYRMTICSTNAPARQVALRSSGGGERPGGFILRGVPMKSVASFLEDLGRAAYEQGHFEQAKPLLEESLAFYRERRAKRNIAWLLSQATLVALCGLAVLFHVMRKLF